MIYLGLLDSQEIPDGYDKYMWMSERCLEGAAWCKNKGIEFQCIPKNWKTNEEILECKNYLNEVKKVVMNYAVDMLNEYHETQYSQEAWNIVLSQWLNTYLFSLYDKYLKLKQVEEMGEDCECYLYDTEKIVPALDFPDYWTMLSETDKYHIYQYSQLYDAMKPFKRIKACNIKKFCRLPIKYQDKSLGYWKVAVYRKFVAFIKFLTRKKDIVVIQNSYLPDTLLLNAMKKKKGELTNYITDYYRYERTELKQDIDSFWRKQEQDFFALEDEFTLLACKLLRRNIPIAYVEDFRFLQERVRRVYKYAMHPQAVVFANGATCNDELFKAYLMNIKNKNTLFCGIQHGGNYGIDCSWMLDSEYEMCDLFYTWGWENNKKTCTFKPMPLVKLVNRSFRKTTTKSDILYVSYSFTKNIGRLDKNELMYDENLQSEKQFLFNLDLDIKSHMRIRMYMRDFGWGVRKDLENRDSDLRFDTISNFYESLDNAKLVILAEWSTTVVEALCANRPILVRRDSWCIEEDAQADLDDLERAGILVDSFEKLNQQLNNILPNLDKWWNETERQTIIKRICNKYAYMPANADKIWLKEIISLAK